MDISEGTSSSAPHRADNGGHSPRSEGKSAGSREGSPNGSRGTSPKRDIAATDPRRTTAKLVISNLSPNVTAAHLREVCGIWGTVTDLTFVEDARAPCAIVEFSLRTEAQDALDHMHRMSFDHTEMLVSFTVDSDPKTAVALSAYGQVSIKDEPKKRSAEPRRGSPPSRGQHHGRRGRSPRRSGGGGGGRDSYRGPPPRGYSPRRHYDRDAPPRARSPPRYGGDRDDRGDRDRGDRGGRDFDRGRDSYSPPRSRYSPPRYDSYNRHSYDSRGRSPPRDSWRGDRNDRGRGRSPVRRRSPSPAHDRERRRSPTRGHYGSPEPKRHSRYSPARSPDHMGR